MARPITIDNETILDAARTLFLEKGWSVPTAAIARAAGVSEGTLFKRFGNKEELFHAAMGIPGIKVALGTEDLAGKNTVRENLTTLATRLLDFYRELMPRIQRVCTHPGFDPHEFIRRHPNPPPLRAIRCISAYLDAEARIDRVRPCDSEVVARMLMGALHSYIFFEQAGLNQKMPLGESTYARGVVDVLLNGILLEDQDA